MKRKDFIMEIKNKGCKLNSRLNADGTILSEFGTMVVLPKKHTKSMKDHITSFSRFNSYAEISEKECNKFRLVNKDDPMDDFKIFELDVINLIFEYAYTKIEDR